MTLVRALHAAAQAEANAPGTLSAFLDGLRDADPDVVRAEAPALIEAIATVQAQLRQEMDDVSDRLADVVATRRGVRGFGAVKPSVRGQRLDTKA